MSIIILLILISLSIAVVFLLIFYWSMKNGQYDDTYTPSVRMLFEDKRNQKKASEEKQELPSEKSENWFSSAKFFLILKSL